MEGTRLHTNLTLVAKIKSQRAMKCSSLPMKTILIALGLEVAALLAHAQGAIWFGNTDRTPVFIALSDNSRRLATAEDNLFIGVFYGTDPSALVVAPGLPRLARSQAS